MGDYTLTSIIDINMATRSALVLETKDSFCFNSLQTWITKTMFVNNDVSYWAFKAEQNKYRDALYTDRRSNFNTAMAQFKPLNLTGRFALTFKKKIEKPSFLIKYGDKKGPIREEVDLRCETLDQHYNSSKPVDFVKGEHGDIIIERSSGNFCSQHRWAKLSLRGKGVK